MAKITREGVSNAQQSGTTESTELTRQGKAAEIYWPKKIRQTG